MTGAVRDIRESTQGQISYHLQWQAGDGGHPVTIEWPVDLPLGDLCIRDDMSGIFIPCVDMATDSALVISAGDSFITGAEILATSVVDTEPPLCAADLEIVTYDEGQWVTLAWPPCVDDHFAYYEVLYDTLYFYDTASLAWDWTEDPALLQQATSTTTVTWPPSASRVTFRIRAWDQFGNASALSYLVFAGDPTEVNQQIPLLDIQGIHVYPNPFNPNTMIRFDLNKATKLSLDVFDLTGKHLAQLAENTLFPAGRSEVAWQGIDENGVPVATGVYVCKLTANSRTWTAKMALLR